MQWVPENASKTGHLIDGLFYLGFWITAFTFLFVVGILVYFLIRYRERNMSEIASHVAYFKKELTGHMREEEKVLFPFLRKHIPRLEPVVYLLLSEHQDFREGLRSMQLCLRSYRRKMSLGPSLRDALCDRGTYLTCLLRSHMWVESSSLYKAADTELQPEERAELLGRIRRGAGSAII